ncbi:unnamed protein product [Pieris brassicae]|uniref:Uncharacterized protein n=1 Tax=Pieris brassicae TaxID=7116 RepID=A0A9P0TRJ4_PIEBR|nr:unnamed protein product [Pieris brassicae]
MCIAKALNFFRCFFLCASQAKPRLNHTTLTIAVAVLFLLHYSLFFKHPWADYQHFTQSEPAHLYAKWDLFTSLLERPWKQVPAWMMDNLAEVLRPCHPHIEA